VELQGGPGGTRPTLRFSEKIEYPPAQPTRGIEPSPGRGSGIEPSLDIESCPWTQELGLLGFHIGMEPPSQLPLPRSQVAAYPSSDNHASHYDFCPNLPTSVSVGSDISLCNILHFFKWIRSRIRLPHPHHEVNNGFILSSLTK
jgi:hypothetical protein